VFASSSSGYTSGQNLEVLYIIRNGIWNISNNPRIINKYEIVLKQQLDTVSYLEEQKISAGLHLEIKIRACLHLEKLK
jgi:hypothetical protein